MRRKIKRLNRRRRRIVSLRVRWMTAWKSSSRCCLILSRGRWKNKSFLFRNNSPRITSSSTFPGKLKGGQPGFPRKLLRNDSIVGERTFYQKYLEPIVKIRFLYFPNIYSSIFWKSFCQASPLKLRKGRR